MAVVVSSAAGGGDGDRRGRPEGLSGFTNVVTNDPVARYTAGAVLVAAFIGCLAIAVHGYWLNPSYQLPAYVASVLSAGLGGALTLLGVHLGTSGTTQGVNQGAQVASQGAQVVTEAGSTKAST